MSEVKNDEVIAVKGKAKWRSKWVCRSCRGTTWKTVAKDKEYSCRKCGKANTGVLFIWDKEKKGLVMWVPPVVVVPEPTPVVVSESVTPVIVGDAVAADGVEPSDGVEPAAQAVQTAAASTEAEAKQ